MAQSEESKDSYNSQYLALDEKSIKDEVLCIHCKRTQNNKIRCLGICVADNDY